MYRVRRGKSALDFFCSKRRSMLFWLLSSRRVQFYCVYKCLPSYLIQNNCGNFEKSLSSTHSKNYLIRIATSGKSALLLTFIVHTIFKVEAYICTLCNLNECKKAKTGTDNNSERDRGKGRESFCNYVQPPEFQEDGE